MIRAGLRCCNPNCRRITVAFNGTRITKIGEAAHIHAQNEGGPRYIPNYDASNIENGIWLCSSCHSLIDKIENVDVFSAILLKKWKSQSESEYYKCLYKPRLDFSKYIAEKAYNGTFLNLNELSDLQMLLFLYSCCDMEINYCFSIDPEEDSFFDFYRVFYENWFVNSDQDIIRSKLQCAALPSVLELQQSNTDRYLNLKEMITSALLSEKLRGLVFVENKQLKMKPATVYEKVFSGDFTCLDDFLNYWWDNVGQ